MKIKLEKSQTDISIIIPDDKVLDIIVGKDIPGIGHDNIKQIISKGIKAQTTKDITVKKNCCHHPG